MEIIPAILTADVNKLDGELRRVRDSKKFARVQIDFIDGEFADNRTIKPVEADLIPYLPLKFDAHLMVSENNIVEWSKTAKKMGFDRIIAQVESISHPENFSGLAIDVHSPIEVIKPYLNHLEEIVVMAVEPGFGGQELDPKILEKVGELSHLRDLSRFRYQICVDGGVQKENMKALEVAGADEVAVGAERVLLWI